MKATEQYFPMALFIMLYKVFLTFESVDEIPTCYHSNESYRAVLSCSGAVYYAVLRWFEVINLWTKSLREAVQVKHKAMYATQHFSCTVWHTAPSGANIKHPNNAVHFRVEDCVLCTVQNCSNDTLAWLTFAVFLFFAVLLLFSLLSWLVTVRLLFNSVAVRRCARSLSSPIRMK